MRLELHSYQPMITCSVPPNDAPSFRVWFTVSQITLLEDVSFCGILQLSKMSIDMERPRLSWFALGIKHISRTIYSCSRLPCQQSHSSLRDSSSCLSLFYLPAVLDCFLAGQQCKIGSSGLSWATLQPSPCLEVLHHPCICKHFSGANLNGIAGRPAEADASKVDTGTTQAIRSHLDSSIPEQAPLTTNSMQGDAAAPPQVGGNVDLLHFCAQVENVGIYGCGAPAILHSGLPGLPASELHLLTRAMRPAGCQLSYQV